MLRRNKAAKKERRIWCPMKERADGEQWRSENHSLIETSFPVSEKAGSKHKYINWKADMGNVRLIFLLGSITTFAHLCRREKLLRAQGKKGMRNNSFLKTYLPLARKKSNKYRYLGHGKTQRATVHYFSCKRQPRRIIKPQRHIFVSCNFSLSRKQALSLPQDTLRFATATNAHNKWRHCIDLHLCFMRGGTLIFTRDKALPKKEKKKERKP